VLEHEVDGDRGAGALRIEHPLDPELDVVGGERSAVGPGQPVAEMEDVPEPVVRDLPALGERGDDRPLRPRLHEAVEELHARLDVRPRDGALRVEVIGQEARPDAQALGRRARLGRRPVLERTLVGLVRLGEAQRGVEGERKLEEHERDLLPLPAALEQR